MDDSVVPTCPYCRAPASGRFCASCGKSLDVSVRDTAVARELFGLKMPAYASIGRTLGLAVAAPATLSRRWATGDRYGLTSPIAMLSIVSGFTALVSVVLTRLTGNLAPGAADAAALGNVLDAVPFVRDWFPVAAAAAKADPASFAGRLRQVGSWLTVAWPALFLVPGMVALAPWRRISRHDALIVACVETVVIMVLAGIYAALRIAAPALVGNFLVTTVIWAALVGHGAWHVRKAVPGAGWGYAAARPLLATLVFPAVVYVWMVGVVGVALGLGPLLGG